MINAVGCAISRAPVLWLTSCNHTKAQQWKIQQEKDKEKKKRKQNNKKRKKEKENVLSLTYFHVAFYDQFGFTDKMLHF